MSTWDLFQIIRVVCVLWEEDFLVSIIQKNAKFIIYQKFWFIIDLKARKDNTTHSLA
jgi:hypothetical protein